MRRQARAAPSSVWSWRRAPDAATAHAPRVRATTAVRTTQPPRVTCRCAVGDVHPRATAVRWEVRGAERVDTHMLGKAERVEGLATTHRTGFRRRDAPFGLETDAAAMVPIHAALGRKIRDAADVARHPRVEIRADHRAMSVLAFTVREALLGVPASRIDLAVDRHRAAAVDRPAAVSGHRVPRAAAAPDERQRQRHHPRPHGSMVHVVRPSALT